MAAFSFAPINLDSYVLNDGERTVATITPQGYVDWVLPGPRFPGRRITAIAKETHLSYVLGTKFNLHFPHLTEVMTKRDFAVLDNGKRARLTAQSRSPDGNFAAEHVAEIWLDSQSGRYQWILQASLRCAAPAPVALKWIEYTNVYPFGAGRCMLFAPHKRYDRTILTAADGAVWDFPHQHALHYTRKIAKMDFAVGSLGGFFLEDLNPVVIVQEATLAPDWAICDMYYDLHCGARPSAPIEPDAEHRFVAIIKYLDRDEARPLLQQARRVPIEAEDYRCHQFPRLALGMNDFREAIGIDRPDDASAFRVQPPEKTWERHIDASGKGALRLCNATAKETVWSATPPTQIPSCHRLCLAALAKTEGVNGKGVFLRVRYHTFVWRPQPHIEWVKTLESAPLSGTNREWQMIAVPPLDVPAEHFDYLVWLDVVLDGRGTAWVTDMDVNLQTTGAEAPVAPEDVPAGSRTPAKG